MQAYSKKQCTRVLSSRLNLSFDVLLHIFAYLGDAQGIGTMQKLCRFTRRWKYDKLHEWKLDWVYKNVTRFLGAEKTIQLRDGSLTEIDLTDNEIGAEGERQSERH